MKLRRIGSFLLDLVYPPVCVLCGEYSAGELLCPSCRDALELLRSDGFQEEEIRRLHPELGLLLTPFVYTGTVRSLLIRLKTHPDFRAVDFLAGELARAAADSGAVPDLVTCMPMSKEKLRRRGFNHARLLGEAAARDLGCRFDGGLLENTGGLTDQHSLAGNRRAEHARSSIRPGPKRLSGERVLLVDDICTTGSSLAAASEALRGLGAGEVIAAAAAITPRD